MFSQSSLLTSFKSPQEANILHSLLIKPSRSLVSGFFFEGSLSTPGLSDTGNYPAEEIVNGNHVCSILV